MKVKVKRPPSSVVKVFLRLVEVLVSVTTAPGTAPPPASSAAPLSVAVAVCALTIALKARSGVNMNRLSRRIIDFCILGLLRKINHEETKNTKKEQNVYSCPPFLRG